MDVKGERFDHAARGRARQRARRGARTPTSTPPTCKALVDEFKAIVQADTGRDFPTDPYEQLDLAIKAVFASWFGKRAEGLPQQPEDRPRPRHGGQRRDDGLRQHGRRLRHRRRVHPRPEHRREGALRRVPDQRPGRGRRGRHPDRAEDQPRCRRTCPRSTTSSSASASSSRRHYRDVQDLEFTIERGRLYMLQTARREADRGGRREDRGRHGRRGHRSRQGGGGRPDRAGPGRPAPAGDVRPERAARAPRKIVKGLNASPGAAVGRAVFDADTAVEWVEPRREGHPRPDRDLAGRLPRHGRGRGHHHRPRRRHLARRGRRPPDRQAVRRRLGRPRSSTTPASRRTATSPGPTSRRATGSASTARPATLYLGALPTVEARFEDQPELQKILGWADEIRRMGVWTNADKPEEAAQARGYGAAGHRPVPDRAHVPRGRAARDRARRDPRRQRGDPGQGQGAPPARRSTPTRPRPSPRSTPRWPSSRSSSRATSRASSGRWTACRSSSA